MKWMTMDRPALNQERVKLHRLIWLALALFGALASFYAHAQQEYYEETVEEDGKKVRYLYPKKAKVDFTGQSIEGELKNPADFYFQHRTQEKFDSLVKRRPNFHREMLRDAVMSK